MDVTKKTLSVLNEVTGGENKELFPIGSSANEKLQLLTSESMLALIFITTLEDEFSIEFDDDEVDITFFRDIDELTEKIKKHLT